MSPERVFVNGMGNGMIWMRVNKSERKGGRGIRRLDYLSVRYTRRALLSSEINFHRACHLKFRWNFDRNSGLRSSIGFRYDERALYDFHRCRRMEEDLFYNNNPVE